MQQIINERIGIKLYPLLQRNQIMTRKILTSALPAIGVSILGLFGTAFSLSPYAWEYRPVYVFAPSASDQDLTAQLESLRALDTDLRERNIALITVTDKVQTYLGPDETTSANSLRGKYDVAPESFTIILVGKDTGVKLRKNAPLGPQILFRTIDAMPMRQNEMREQGF